MAYVVAQPCIGTKDRSCVEVCPVECFYEGQDQLYIHPQECVDCDACKPVCPVDAIFAEEDVPEKWQSYIEKNAIFTLKEGDEKPPLALTKDQLADPTQNLESILVTKDGRTIVLPPPPPGFENKTDT